MSTFRAEIAIASIEGSLGRPRSHDLYMGIGEPDRSCIPSRRFIRLRWSGGRCPHQRSAVKAIRPGRAPRRFFNDLERLF